MQGKVSGMASSLPRTASAVAFYLCSVASCLLMTDRNKDQCSTTADCELKGAGFQGTQCVEGVCIVPGDGSSNPGSAECKATPDCLANPNKPNTYCSKEKQCLPMTSADCATIVTSDGKPIASDAIILGVMAPLTGDNAADGAARFRAVNLAYEEFVSRQVGIPTGPGTRPRPLALVICDQVADAVRAATHLAYDVGVPAIIGPGFSGTTVKVAMNVTIPAGVLLMSPSATTPDLSTLQDNGLVWRTSSSFAPESKGFAEELAQMESDPSVRSALGLSSGAPIKVAVLAKGDSYGKGLADLLQTTLRFNGTDVAGNGIARFARYDFPDLAANPSADLSGIIGAMVGNFMPNFVLLVGTAEIISKGMVSIEGQWPTGASSPARPYYLVSEGAKLAELISAVAQSTDRHPDQKLTSRVRVFGPRYNQTLYSLLQNRYSAAYNEPMPDIYGVTGSYDAFYLIAYALLASQNPSVPTGASIASGLARTVPPGQAITAGPTDISKAVSELAAGRNIDYDGVTGSLDFEVTTGDSIADYDLFCVQGTGFRATGQYYRSATSQMNGSFAACP